MINVYEKIFISLYIVLYTENQLIMCFLLKSIHKKGFKKP